MNWYKKSQFTEENMTDVSVPSIVVTPYEPIVQEAVNELVLENPNYFVGVSKILVDPGYGQFGFVSSENPADININLQNIKNVISRQIGGSFDPNNEEHRAIFKNQVKRVIVHEKGHVTDAQEAQEGSGGQILSGEELFPGGEGVAERREQEYFR